MHNLLNYIGISTSNSNMDGQFGMKILSSLLGNLGIPNNVLMPHQDQSMGIGVDGLHKLFLSPSIKAQHAYQNPSTRTVMLSSRDDDMLDKQYNYDFTNISDNGVTFYRGGMIYNRPCGWKRYAYNVKGKYPDDIWLNGKHPRKNIYSSAEDEWPVSYHGTSLNEGLSIADEGFRLSKCKRFKHGYGIYSTPDINIAKLYASTTEGQGRHGRKYKVILQSRVNPKTLQIVYDAETGAGEYWVSPNEDDIRPYGFCIQEY
jgi:hypothetical protein